MSSLTSCTQESNPGRINGWVTVIVIVLVAWPAAAEAVGAYVNALAMAAVVVGGGTAAAYNRFGKRA
ncbi:hypothetical protein ACWGNM_11665 [Streptomyces sp. NPDC055796]